MKFNFIFLVPLLLGCSKVSQSTEQFFNNKCKEIDDSVFLLFKENMEFVPLFLSLNLNESDSAKCVFVFSSLLELNELIDSTMSLIMLHATNSKDLKIANELINRKEIGKIMYETATSLKYNLKLKYENELKLEIINLISPNDSNIGQLENNSTLKIFKNLPVYAAIPILKRWKLNNTLACNRIFKEFRNN